MYIYHALINALSTHMIHINLNMIFCTHVEHSPTKTICIKYYKKIIYKKNKKYALHTHTHTHTHTFNTNIISNKYKCALIHFYKAQNGNNKAVKYNT